MQRYVTIVFQSPYGDLGNTTDDLSFSTEELFKGFSPLTGIWVIRHCLSVPALGAGPQAIFSNLRLFSPFSETRVKNKIWAVSFFPLVTPFAAVFEIFKPRRFFLPKSVFFRLTYYPYLYLVYFFWLILSIGQSSQAFPIHAPRYFPFAAANRESGLWWPLSTGNLRLGRDWYDSARCEVGSSRAGFLRSL